MGNIDNANLVLVRGLPGSGKSTLAKEIAGLGFVHLETDMFFQVEGGYVHDAAQLEQAHAWCQAQAAAELAAGKRVVVSNVFHRRNHMEAYLKLSTSAVVVEMKGNYGSVHGVPDEIVEFMKSEWDHYEGAIQI